MEGESESKATASSKGRWAPLPSSRSHIPLEAARAVLRRESRNVPRFLLREREREREKNRCQYSWCEPNTPGLPAVAEGVRIPFPSFQTGSPFEQSSTRTFPVASRPTTTSPSLTSLTESPPSSPARPFACSPALCERSLRTLRKEMAVDGREWPRISEAACCRSGGQADSRV